MSSPKLVQDVLKPPLRIPPPLVMLFLIAAGLSVHAFFPRLLLPEGWIQFVVGLPTVGLGIALSGRSLKRFTLAGTDERYAEPTSVIVQDGLYARTRNPMFLGAVLIHLGVVLAVNAGWALLGVPLFVLYLHFGVIRREEGFLERRFGEEYVTYTMRVPRWVPQLTDR